MTTGQWIILDHVVALLSVAAWFAAGVAVAFRRVRLALGLLTTAVLVTLARVGTVAMLAGRGWWFVQEKVLLGLPMLAFAGLAAVLVAGPRLLGARRAPDEPMSARPARHRSGSAGFRVAGSSAWAVGRLWRVAGVPALG